MESSSDPLDGIDTIPWASLDVAYDEGWRIPGILRRLAADDPEEVDLGWDEVSEQILWHQGTVYPATAAAAPFVARTPRPHTRADGHA